MKVLNKIKTASVKYPISIIGYTGTFCAEAVGLTYLCTGIIRKDMHDLIIGASLISSGVIAGAFSRKAMKDERNFYEERYREVEKAGFTETHIKHIDKKLLKIISKEKHLENEYREALEKYSE